VRTESITTKPGVLFAPTASGGILMDLHADKFVALTPVSAAIWDSIAAGRSVQDVLSNVTQMKGLQAEQAEALLTRQLALWEKAELLNTPEAPVSLPRPKSAPALAPGELPMASVADEALNVALVAKLFLAEVQYRRTMSRQGLARTLVLLQSEKGASPKAPEAVMRRVVRSYHALRRAFRQGRTSYDCLFRSLALAAVLRRKGINADLCIGIIDLPFTSHAWVEALGLVLNETASKRDEYTAVGRF
jgi:hypothetical protein